MAESTLLRLSGKGIYCPAGDFYIDPWQPVEKAITTHGHSDHARWGSSHYLTARDGEKILRTRLGASTDIQSVEYGESVVRNGVQVSLHPAGHVLGSAQVRVEHRGEVWVVSGDYKTEPDETCKPFEVVKCHTFITESTFGLPIYRWCPSGEVFDEINTWWRSNQQSQKASVLLAYALGKAQRLLGGVDAGIGPIFAHGAVEGMNRVYRDSGVKLPNTQHTGDMPKGYDWSQALVVAPVSALGSPWMRKFGAVSTGFASGWMQIRGARRRRGVDRGFVMSDHVDWPNLVAVIRETEAHRVWVTHGYSGIVVRWLLEQGYDARVLNTHFEGELEDEEGIAAEDGE